MVGYKIFYQGRKHEGVCMEYVTDVGAHVVVEAGGGVVVRADNQRLLPWPP